MPTNANATPKRSQSQLRRYVLEIAELYGWMGHDASDEALDLCTGYPDGFPTIVLLRERRLVFVVVVYRSRRLTVQQARWARALENVGSVEVHLIGPDDERGIAPILRGSRGQTEAVPVPAAAASAQPSKSRRRSST